MILADVMGELGDACDTITGLRVFRWPADDVPVPAVVVAFPEQIDYHVTKARGVDRMSVPVVLAISRADERSAALNVSPYVSGSGSASIVAAIEAFAYTACDFAVVKSCTFEPYTIASVEYLAAIFTVDVVGPGSTE